MQPEALVQLPADGTFQPEPFSIGEQARQRAASRARKSDLLVEAARHFCDLARPKPQEISLFKELFYQFIDVSDKSERRMLAATLARNPYTPRTVLLFLALDECEIAAPILLFSEALTEGDIAAIARRASQAHREVLCRRSALSPANIRVLIETGGHSCALLLGRNSLLLADKTLRDMLSAPSEEVLHHEPEPVALHEPDLPPAGWRQDELVEPEAPAVIEVVERTPFENTLMELAARGGKLGSGQPRETEQPPRYDPHLPFERQALQAARRKDVTSFASFVQDYCGLAWRSTAAIVREGGVDSICVLLKGLGLSYLGSLQCLLQLDRDLGRNLAAYNNAKAMLARLDVHECRAFVESLGGNFSPARIRPIPNEIPDAGTFAKLAAQRRRDIVQSVTEPPRERTARSGARGLTAGIV